MNRTPLLLLVSTVIGLAGTSYAQNSPPTFLIERAQRGGQVGSPDSSMKGADWLTSVMKDGFPSRGTSDESLWCPNGQCVSGSGMGTNTSAKMPSMEGEKHYHFPSVASFGGFADLRSGVSTLNVDRGSRMGPIGIEFMSLALAEPSVQKADADAAKVSADLYGNLLHSLNGFLNMASGNPETREWVLQALNSCVKKKQETMSSVQALAQCLYDREVAVTQGVGAVTGIGFKLSDHPDITQASSGSNTRLCLDDLAFNRAQESMGGAAGPPAPPLNTGGGSCLSDLGSTNLSGQATPTDLRRYINSRIGCFCNTSTWDTATASSGTAAGDPAAARELSFAYTAPRPTNGRTPLQQDFFNNFESVYTTMQQVMLNYCTSKTQSISLGDNPLNFNQPTRRYWEVQNGFTPEQIRTLSMEGFTVDPPLLEAIYSFFERSKLPTAHTPLTSTDCTQNFGPSAADAQLTAIIQDPKRAADYTRFIFKYSLIVARGQYLSSLQVMQQFLTSVPANAWVRGKIYENYVDKIAKAARIGDDDNRSLSKMLEDNVQEAQNWRRDLFLYVQSKIGNGGRNVTGHVKDSTMGGSPDIAAGQ